jgi:hypothetical protein
MAHKKINFRILASIRFQEFHKNVKMFIQYTVSVCLYSAYRVFVFTSVIRLKSRTVLPSSRTNTQFYFAAALSRQRTVVAKLDNTNIISFGLG